MRTLFLAEPGHMCGSDGPVDGLEGRSEPRLGVHAGERLGAREALEHEKHAKLERPP